MALLFKHHFYCYMFYYILQWYVPSELCYYTVNLKYTVQSSQLSLRNYAKLLCLNILYNCETKFLYNEYQHHVHTEQSVKDRIQIAMYVRTYTWKALSMLQPSLGFQSRTFVIYTYPVSYALVHRCM